MENNNKQLNRTHETAVSDISIGHNPLLDLATQIISGEYQIRGTLEETSPSLECGDITAVAAQRETTPVEVYPDGLKLKPTDYSDVGQASVFARDYGNQIRYSPVTGFIIYNGSCWEESQTQARALAHELTSRQLEESEAFLVKASDDMISTGVSRLLTPMGKRKASLIFTPDQEASFRRGESASKYYDFVMKHRESKNISALLKEVEPMIEIDPRLLDAGAFLINTPSVTYDLRVGIESARDHDPEDLITKQTAVDPSNDGMELWMEALNTFFCGDADLIDYVQEVVGLSAIGKVFNECLFIAYGDGCNGKSTFFNVIARVLGAYSGNLSADVLTTGCRRNPKPELAEIRGKRIVIASELEDGLTLSTSILKQICSTDEIYAEKKYKAPFSFTPSHTVFLCTNHLPKVATLDTGTWRRLKVIPFNAKIERSADKKNYADTLFKKAGGAILKWIMEGAKKVIENNYHLCMPAVVEAAFTKYREDNDIIAQFIFECCETESSFTQGSKELRDYYNRFCDSAGGYHLSPQEFKKAIERKGYMSRRSNKGTVFHGLRLSQESRNDSL